MICLSCLPPLLSKLPSLGSYEEVHVSFIFLSALYSWKEPFVRIERLEDDYIDYNVLGP